MWCSQLFIYFWKHWKTFRSSWKCCLISIVAPIAIVAAAVYLVPQLDLMALVAIMQLMLLFFIQNVIFLPMIEEKECGIREFVRIASSYAYLNDITRFIIGHLLTLFIVGISLYLVDNQKSFTQHISWICLIILIVLYTMALVAFTFAISSLFTSIFVAKFGGTICFVAAVALQRIHESLWVTSSMNALNQGITIIKGCENNGNLKIFKL